MEVVGVINGVEEGEVEAPGTEVAAGTITGADAAVVILGGADLVAGAQAGVMEIIGGIIGGEVKKTTLMVSVFVCVSMFVFSINIYN